VLWSEQKRNGVFAVLLKNESILRKRADLRESWQIAAALGAKSDPSWCELERYSAYASTVQWTEEPWEEQLKREVLQHECR
jgi:hypothetical protein